MNTVLVTGGAGFIGSTLVKTLLAEADVNVVNLDALTYAGNLDSLREVADHARYRFVRADIADGRVVRSILETCRPRGVVHLAAETHVDRSIDAPGGFVHTNVVGTYALLDECHRYWRKLSGVEADRFRFVHVSTDEVFGSLGSDGRFSEQSPYRPNSPYAASKASADMLVRAWVNTYEFPAITANCSNNYGPYQFPEKLVPLMILGGIAGQRLPVYGNGQNVRDWLFVQDHARALLRVLDCGEVGRQYLIGGEAEHSNIDVVRRICALLDEMVPTDEPRERLIDFVTDRPGHDLRYAVDPERMHRELGWQPLENFDSGLRKTVAWYLSHQEWGNRVQSGAYRGERLGLRVAV